MVHGRSGGSIPPELRALAADLAGRRAAPVWLQALTAPEAPLPPPADALDPPLTLVPLLLFPGGHVRRDLPALASALGRGRPLRRLPFLGAWPLWQAALAAEVGDLPPGDGPPLLLHHPLEGSLGQRYLALLARRCSGRCQPAAAAAGQAQLGPSQPFLPLALAANRLTDELAALGLGPAARPLLARSRLRGALAAALQALP